MTLQWGRPMVAIPGPSVIPDVVLQAMHQPMSNIYEGELAELTQSIRADLSRVARTDGTTFLAVSNGHGAWEMALTNTLNRGDRVLVLATGHFGPAWGQMGAMLGLDVETLEGPLDAAFDPAMLAERLARDPNHEIRAVLVVQVDTGTSVLNDISALRDVIDAAGHPALYMVDGIASLGCTPFEMDAWGVDVTVGATQKGLMVPPGIGIVWANDRALAAHEKADLRSGYWDWAPRLSSDPPHYYQYGGTPPATHIHGLRAGLDLLLAEGLEQAWHRHRVLAGAVHAAVEAWSTPSGLALNIAEPAERAPSVTTVLTHSIDGDGLRSRAEERAGLVLGVPVGDFAGRAFRIGHMGHLNPPMLLGTLGTIEATLISMGAPINESGSAAAATVIASELANG